MTANLVFRTNNPSAWGNGQGSDLSASQIDMNFWILYSSIQAIQAHADTQAGIESFTVLGTQFFVNLTNHVALGPFTLPQAQWNFRGEWQANQTYNINDVFTAFGAVYLVIFAVPNSGAAPFFSGANDGHGHQYYATLLAAPPSELPADGNPGAFLQLSLLDSPGSVVWTNLTRNIAFYLETPPNPDEEVLRYVVPEQMTFPLNLIGSYVNAGTSPTSVQEYQIYQNGANIGTISFTASPDTPTATFPAPITFAPGDILSIIAPSVPDPHMTLIAITLVGTLP
jgi:hypothetical protein